MTASASAATAEQAPRFSSSDLLRRINLTYRQLDYLRANLLGERIGTGTPRSFTWSEVVDIAKYAALIDYGLPPRKAWDLIQRENAGEPPPAGDPVVWLCTNWELLVQRLEVEFGYRSAVDPALL